VLVQDDARIASRRAPALLKQPAGDRCRLPLSGNIG
jgi:hypothetical protein